MQSVTTAQAMENAIAFLTRELQATRGRARTVLVRRAAELHGVGLAALQREIGERKAAQDLARGRDSKKAHRYLSLRVYWNQGGKDRSAVLCRRHRNALYNQFSDMTDRYEFSPAASCERCRAQRSLIHNPPVTNTQKALPTEEQKNEIRDRWSTWLERLDALGYSVTNRQATTFLLKYTKKSYSREITNGDWNRFFSGVEEWTETNPVGLICQINQAHALAEIKNPLVVEQLQGDDLQLTGADCKFLQNCGIAVR